MSVIEAVGNETRVQRSSGQVLDLGRFGETPLRRDPFDFLIVENLIRPAALPAIYDSFPSRLGPGSHPVNLVNVQAPLKALLDELHGPGFRAAVEDKFGVPLQGCPTACTLRSETNERDGNIHTDSRSKIITVLIYLNERWDIPGGRLRLLRSNDNLDDYVAEVSPIGGTMLVFRRAENSWHGHERFIGPRRAIQFNWVTRSSVQMRENVRHGISHLFKKVTHFAG